MQNDKKFFECTIRNAIYYICYKTFLLCCIAKKALYIQAYTCKNFSDLCRYVCNAILLCIHSRMNIYLGYLGKFSSMTKV